MYVKTAMAWYVRHPDDVVAYHDNPDTIHDAQSFMNRVSRESLGAWPDSAGMPDHFVVTGTQYVPGYINMTGIGPQGQRIIVSTPFCPYVYVTPSGPPPPVDADQDVAMSTCKHWASSVTKLINHTLVRPPKKKEGGEDMKGGGDSHKVGLETGEATNRGLTTDEGKAEEGTLEALSLGGRKVVTTGNGSGLGMMFTRFDRATRKPLEGLETEDQIDISAAFMPQRGWRRGRRPGRMPRRTNYTGAGTTKKEKNDLKRNAAGRDGDGDDLETKNKKRAVGIGVDAKPRASDVRAEQGDPVVTFQGVVMAASATELLTCPQRPMACLGIRDWDRDRRDVLYKFYAMKSCGDVFNVDRSPESMFQHDTDVRDGKILRITDWDAVEALGASGDGTFFHVGVADSSAFEVTGEGAAAILAAQFTILSFDLEATGLNYEDEEFRITSCSFVWYGTPSKADEVRLVIMWVPQESNSKDGGSIKLGPGETRDVDPLKGTTTLVVDNYRDFLSKILEVIYVLKPPAVLGHNSNGYDIPALFAAARREGLHGQLAVAFSWSPQTVPPTLVHRTLRTSAIGTVKYFHLSSLGLVSMDLLMLARMFFPGDCKKRGFSLNVMGILVGRNKVDMPYTQQLEIFHRGTPSDRRLLVMYNVVDSVIPLLMLYKKKMVGRLMAMCSVSASTLSEVLRGGQTVRVFNSFCELFEKQRRVAGGRNIVTPTMRSRWVRRWAGAGAGGAPGPTSLKPRPAVFDKSQSVLRFTRPAAPAPPEDKTPKTSQFRPAEHMGDYMFDAMDIDDALVDDDAKMTGAEMETVTREMASVRIIARERGDNDDESMDENDVDDDDDDGDDDGDGDGDGEEDDGDEEDESLDDLVGAIGGTPLAKDPALQKLRSKKKVRLKGGSAKKMARFIRMKWARGDDVYLSTIQPKNEARYVGGFVLKSAQYQGDILVLDFASLYPSDINQFNMSPDTMTWNLADIHDDDAYAAMRLPDGEIIYFLQNFYIDGSPNGT